MLFSVAGLDCVSLETNVCTTGQPNMMTLGFFICLFTSNFYNPSLSLWLNFVSMGFNLLIFIPVDKGAWQTCPFM